MLSLFKRKTKQPGRVGLMISSESLVMVLVEIRDGRPVLLDVLDADLDDGSPEPGANLFRLIESEEFRYGRLLVDNAFGPETEDQDIPVRVQYFNGTEFITNVEDDCTALLFDESDPALGFVAGSFESTGLGTFDAASTALEGDPVSDVEVKLFDGVTARQEDGDEDDGNDPDRPFFTTAPDPNGDSDITGRALVEFDLQKLGLDFLSYDWREDSEADVYDEIPDGDYGDNPRGVIESGSYRGHDRVINWQEIYIGN